MHGWSCNRRRPRTRTMPWRRPILPPSGPCRTAPGSAGMWVLCCAEGGDHQQRVLVLGSCRGSSHIADTVDRTAVKFVYTAMPGVGWRFCQQAFSAFGLPEFIPVEKQVHCTRQYIGCAAPDEAHGCTGGPGPGLPHRRVPKPRRGRGFSPANLSPPENVGAHFGRGF